MFGSQQKRQLYELITDFDPGDNTDTLIKAANDSMRNPRKIYKASPEYASREWNDPDSLEVMKGWLRFPTELGKDPYSISYDQTIINRGKPFNIYKFKPHKEEDEELWGMVDMISPGGGETFSNFHKYGKGEIYEDFLKDRDALSKFAKMTYGRDFSELVSTLVNFSTSDDIFDYAPHGYKWKDADKLSDEQLEELFKYHPDTLAGEETWRRSADDYEGYEPETEEEIQERINQWPVKGRYDKYLDLEGKYVLKEMERIKPYLEAKAKVVKRFDYPTLKDYLEASKRYDKEHPEALFRMPEKGYFVGQFSLGSLISHGIAYDFSDEIFRKVKGNYKRYLRNKRDYLENNVYNKPLGDYMPYGPKANESATLSDDELENIFSNDPSWRTLDYLSDKYTDWKNLKGPDANKVNKEYDRLMSNWPVKSRYDKYNELALKRGDMILENNPGIEDLDYFSRSRLADRWMKKNKYDPYLAGMFSEVDKSRIDNFLIYTLKYTSEDLKVLDKTDYDLLEQAYPNIDRQLVDALLNKRGIKYKMGNRAKMLNMDLGAKLANFSMLTAYVGPVPVDSPQYKQDPTLNYPVFKYSDGSNVVQLHKDDAEVPDIIVISDYVPDSDGWTHDKDFLSGFQEVSKGVPIGKYEVVSED